MRARNMQALTDDVQRRWPGVVVYGIGNAAHKLETSDHNEDDTAGSRAEQSDADSNPEHRAIDIMVGPAFTKADGDALVAALLRDPAARARLKYIIWYGYIWTRSSGWQKVKYTRSDQHTNHVHVSGLAADDENAAGWPAVGKGVDVTEMFPQYGEQHNGVGYVQYQLENLGHDVGTVDNDYGDKTVAALKAFVKAYNGSTVDGKKVTPAIKIYLDVSMMRKFGASTPGPRGPQGIQGVQGVKGDKGDKGEPGTLPATVRLEGTATISAG